jgi:hypothetical protein
MKLRQAAGEINRAKRVFAWVTIDPEVEEGGLYVKIEKVVAKEILDFCRARIDEINGELRGKDFYIDEWQYDDDEEEPLEDEPGVNPEFDETDGGELGT